MQTGWSDVMLTRATRVYVYVLRSRMQVPSNMHIHLRRETAIGAQIPLYTYHVVDAELHRSLVAGGFNLWP